MKNQKRTTMGALDYCIETLRIMKNTLMDYGNYKAEINWAVGGIIVTLVSNLLRTCNDVILDSVATGEPNAREDIKAIQDKFNAFVNQMLNQD